jgi:crotonobetainyl-CoA:carnitine CoA-transferase CaiB-like acyl-CoA transferase
VNPVVLAAVVVSLVLAAVLVWFWLHAQLRYVVGRSSLRIQLFGFTVRRLPFSDIRRVGTPKRANSRFQTEFWNCSLDVLHRGLVVHRQTGWRRRILITPLHRYAFRKELRDAIAAATGTQLSEDEVDPADGAEAPAND